MTIDSQQDLRGIVRVGRVVALAIQAVEAHVRPGVTTAELDSVCEAALNQHRARPAPRLVYGFPGVACIGVNDEAAHGIPGPRVVLSGDLVKIDVTAELDGYFADGCVTVGVPPVPLERQRLLDCAKAALDSALAVARAGVPIARIGTAAELVARRCGLTVVRDLMGHGVGRTIHDAPEVPNFASSGRSDALSEGLVLAIEPHLTSGSGRIATGPDGWTIRTVDRRPVANFEHTIVITRDRPLIVTAA